MNHTLDWYLIEISALWHCQYLWCNSFQLGCNSQIATVWGYAPLILPHQGTTHPYRLEKSLIRPLSILLNIIKVTAL